MAIIREAKLEDLETLVELNKACFPAMAEENVVWTIAQLSNHLRLFPQGQLVAEENGKILGAVSSLIVDLGADAYREHTYAGITDGGYFHNHDPEGDSLYGADVYVDPAARGQGIGHLLYQARRDLCQRLNLRRIIAGGRIHGYSTYASSMSPETYIAEVENGRIKDLVLSFQLREGFIVRGVLKNYIQDPHSKNNATFLEWINPEHQPVEKDGRKVRVSCVQYQVRGINSFEDFADQVEYFVETAADYRSDFVVFPEFFSVQLLSQKLLKKLPAIEGIRRLSEMKDEFMALMGKLAQEYGLYIIAGSHPMEIDGSLQNVCPVFAPDGSFTLHPKLHITPSEKKYWGISGGNELNVISTPKARIGILICYDSEFPEAARYLADQGAEIIFVPYCTDNRHGFLRVRYCSQARAIENQVYVVTAGIIGNLPSVPAMDIHYGKAAVFSPSDHEFARDGIQAEADSNVEMLLVTDLDINDLYRSRASGSVTPMLDRRKDLFQFTSNFPKDKTHPSTQGGDPMGLPV
ncbi:bifunctional GNAT family N-acetyltransferase/carbon-nitrogen hydrolase family protein [Pelagicoccus albus]|uniref:Bifunctional GNAT family N-acetyltransferase/carbon-nitrogen hydrolase family protein n=1 Tax=Pelagicoccus albus TaxID=415222 RepID=A0A7X1B517_9BACT|nr:bifunctional GNAT family N-acetyltransferase/carbon-nitrogen hydrolase family protein [Pelagicoccus albus]MBC2605768.1 bifunctional GNAT family N-acetyltransferase/carbon-nitrogen hydrolase family protein [Pelagicoccus albus]